jgi:hypothetical protein
MINKIAVCMGDKKYFLRIHFETRDGEVIRFQTNEEFSKCEADYRAVSLSARNGWERDELPTHDKVEPYPRNER